MKKLLSAFLVLILMTGCLPMAMATAQSATPAANGAAPSGDSTSGDAALSDGSTDGADDAALSDGSTDGSDDDARSGDATTDEDEIFLDDDESFNADEAGGDALPETPNVAATRGSDGTVSFDSQFTISCPTALESQQVDQQDLQDGLLFSAYSDTMGIDIYKYPQDEDTLQTLYDSYKADGDMSEVTLANVGDVQMLVYRIDETGIDVTLAGSTGSLYDIMITYQTLGEYQQVGQMIGSIKKIVG